MPIGIASTNGLSGRWRAKSDSTEISLSHVVAPLPKFVARADTTVVDAYLNPVLRDYVARLRAALPGSTIRILDVGRRAGRRRAFLRQRTAFSLGRRAAWLGFHALPRRPVLSGRSVSTWAARAPMCRGSMGGSTWNMKRKRPACGWWRRRWRSRRWRPAADRSAGSMA